MGRTSLYMVMGFNMIFMAMGFNLSGISTHAYKNYVNYQAIEQAQFVCESGVNMAVSDLYTTSMQNKGWWKTKDTTCSFCGGSFKIQQTCDSINAYSNTFKVIAQCNGFSDTVILTSKEQRFSQYAMYNVNENGLSWITGDTCDGPLHTEGTLLISGSPKFAGKVTTKSGYKIGGSTYTDSTHYSFPGGYQNAVSNPLPTQQTLANYIKRALPSGGGTGLQLDTAGTAGTKDIYIEFTSNAKMIIKRGPSMDTSSGIWNRSGFYPIPGSPKSTDSSSTFNGVLALTDTGKVNIHIKGKLSGKITIANLGSGNIYLDSSVVYNNENVNHPELGNLSTDMLGIVSSNSVIITENKNNYYDLNHASTGIKIDASIFCLGTDATDGFKPANSTSDYGGTIKLLGGLQQKTRQQVSTGGGANGFLKSYVYDKRLLTKFPPAYPACQYFKLVSWYENMGWSNSIWDIW